MKPRFEWDKEKNQKLKAERKISFEQVVSLIENENVIAIAHGRGRYAHQKQFIVELNGYAYVVPFVESVEFVFLKTIIPSRKLTKKYLLKGGSS